MPVLLPFRADFYSEQAGPLRDLIYIPGEQDARPLRTDFLVQDTEPALFIYRQRFRFPGDSHDSVRDGVMGLLDRSEAAAILLHEETVPARVAACTEAIRDTRTDPGSLWLWCHDDTRTLAPLLETSAPPTFEVEDLIGTRHQLWRVTDPTRISRIQQALQDKELFLADGHHRFAAGWNLATIQVRTEALRTLPSHRLVIEDGLSLPEPQRIHDLAGFVAETPPKRARLGVILPGGELLGIELARDERDRLLDSVRTEAVRAIDRAIHAVETGSARMALLVEPLSIDQIEAYSRGGMLLPPKSTDFYPKLAAGIVMYRHQNESVTPPVPHLPGVR